MKPRRTAMHDRWLLLLALLLLMTSIGRAQRTSRIKPQPTTREPNWIEQTLKKMSLKEKIGQLLMVYFFGEFTSAGNPQDKNVVRQGEEKQAGGFTSTESREYANLIQQVEENHVGGLIIATQSSPLGVVRSQVYPTAILLNQLQRRAKIPLLVGADFESGTSMRLEEGTPFPTAMAIAATGQPQDAYTAGKVAALEARAAGVHWIFAPVADVNLNPDNPIINTRSFGEDPQRVAQFVQAFVRGVEENGALATAKHFPGHGDTSADSHLTLPVVFDDRARLENVELVPFRAAIAAGVGAVMTGHLAVPAFEPDPAIPATLSPRIVTDLLRRELGFDGLVVTDALDMAGLTTLYSPGEIAVRSITAGADVLLMPPYPDAALAALEDAVESGRLPMARVDDAVTRILRAKAKLGLDKNRTVDVDKLNSIFGRPEFAAQAQDIADRGVTLLRDQSHLLPLDATGPLRVLLVELSGDPDPYPGTELEREIRWRVDSLYALRADTRFESVVTLKLPPPDSYDIAIAALFVRVADRKGTVGLPDDEAAFINQLLSAGKPAIVACLGNPYLIERFPGAPTWLAAFGSNEVVQRAIARSLFGQVAVDGQIPVSVPGVANLGDGLRVAANPMTLKPAADAAAAQLKPAFDLLARSVADGAFPGGVLAVGHNDELALHPFGKLTYDANSPAVTAETIYDVASLTKPVVTTTAIMQLTAARRLDLDAPIVRYLPEWANGPNREWRQRVTVRSLLLHDSGLPAHRDYFKESESKKAVLDRAFQEPLVYEPGTRVEYSDLGFMLLGEIVERLTGQSLSTYARGQIFVPLGMANSLFNPPGNLRTEIAPTENDTTFRKRQIQGEVHDQNAWAMGGVAGQAGLFTTADDLAIFAQMMLNGGIYAHRRILTRADIDQFTARQQINETARTLGWDVPSDPSSSGHHFSLRSYGHTGYTGSSLWIDPEKNLFVILLTNRVYPTDKNEKIRQVRPTLHDALLEALGFAAEPAAKH